MRRQGNGRRVQAGVGGMMRRAWLRVAGVGVLLGISALLDRLLAAAGIRFPASVLGMLLAFGGLAALKGAAPVLAARLLALAEPAVSFLNRWMALFFAPALVVLPAVGFPAGADTWKVPLIMVLGFVFTLATTAFLVRLLTPRSGRFQEPVPDAPLPSASEGRLLPPWLFLTGALGVVVLIFRTPWISSVFLIAVTVTAFLLGLAVRSRLAALLPLPEWMKVAVLSPLHPVITGAALTVFVLGATAHSFADYLQPGRMPPPAGNVILALLGPAVVALGFLLYRERLLLKAYLIQILVSVSLAAFLALMSSALLARWFGVGSTYALAVIPRSVTTPIAMPIAEILGAEPAVTAAIVVLTGVLGAAFAVALLNALRLHDPVARGVAVGAGSHGIGTAALLRDEPRAAAAAGVAFALMGAFTSAYIGIPYLRELLRALAVSGP